MQCKLCFNERLVIKSHLALLLTMDAIYKYDLKSVRPCRMFPGFQESFMPTTNYVHIDEKLDMLKSTERLMFIEKLKEHSKICSRELKELFDSL
jgi:hypothetical protein